MFNSKSRSMKAQAMFAQVLGAEVMKAIERYVTELEKGESASPAELIRTVGSVAAFAETLNKVASAWTVGEVQEALAKLHPMVASLNVLGIRTEMSLEYERVAKWAHAELHEMERVAGGTGKCPLEERCAKQN